MFLNKINPKYFYVESRNLLKLLGFCSVANKLRERNFADKAVVTLAGIRGSTKITTNTHSTSSNGLNNGLFNMIIKYVIIYFIII